MYVLYNMSKYRVRLNGETKRLEIDKSKVLMAYPEAAEVAAQSAKSDSENLRRRVPFPRRGSEIGDTTDESDTSPVP